MDFLEHISRLGAEVNRVFLVPTDPPAPETLAGELARPAVSVPRAIHALR
jgi:hypothetical protein